MFQRQISLQIGATQLYNVCRRTIQKGTGRTIRTTDILHGLEKFHHYCITLEVSMIMDHKPSVAILKKGAASLSQRKQRILLNIHQYNIRILYKPGPQLFIVDKLSRHNQETEMKKYWE